MNPMVVTFEQNVHLLSATTHLKMDAVDSCGFYSPANVTAPELGSCLALCCLWFAGFQQRGANLIGAPGQ